jgi:hypothetical protein
MSTLAEIEQAIETLPPPQVEELAAWLEQRRRQKAAAPSAAEPGRTRPLPDWLERSIGTTTTGLSTDEILRETRGED